MSYIHMFTQESKGCCSLMMQYNVLAQLQFWKIAADVPGNAKLHRLSMLQWLGKWWCSGMLSKATVTEGKCTRLFRHIPVLTCLLQIHTHTIFPHSAAPLLVLTTQPLHFSSREGKRPGSKISEITWLLRNHSCNPHIYSSSLRAYDTAVFPGRAIYQQWNISLWLLKCWEKARQDKHIKVLYRGRETM